MKLNLQELIKEHELKAGDEVVQCRTIEGIVRKCHVHLLLHSYTLEINLGIYDDYGKYTLNPDGYFELPTPKKKERHIHADLINWWAECPSENIVEMCVRDDEWMVTEFPYWMPLYKYRKEPSQKEIEIQLLENEKSKCRDNFVKALAQLDEAIKELEDESK